MEYVPRNRLSSDKPTGNEFRQSDQMSQSATPALGQLDLAQEALKQLSASSTIQALLRGKPSTDDVNYTLRDFPRLRCSFYWLFRRGPSNKRYRLHRPCNPTHRRICCHPNETAMSLLSLVHRTLRNPQALGRVILKKSGFLKDVFPDSKHHMPKGD